MKNLISYFFIKSLVSLNQSLVIDLFDLPIQKINRRFHHKKNQTGIHHFILQKYYLLDTAINFYIQHLFSTIQQLFLVLFTLFNDFFNLTQILNNKTIFYYLIGTLT